MPTIEISDLAREDLFDIWYYIAIECQSRSAADKFIIKFDSKFQLLSQNPKIGASRKNLSPNLRMWILGNHEIYYLETKTGIKIVRVLEGHRDIDSLFE